MFKDVRKCSNFKAKLFWNFYFFNKIKVYGKKKPSYLKVEIVDHPAFSSYSYCHVNTAGFICYKAYIWVLGFHYDSGESDQLSWIELKSQFQGNFNSWPTIPSIQKEAIDQLTLYSIF